MFYVSGDTSHRADRTLFVARTFCMCKVEHGSANRIVYLQTSSKLLNKQSEKAADKQTQLGLITSLPWSVDHDSRSCTATEGLGNSE